MREDLRLLAKLAIGFLAGVVLFMLAFSISADAATHTPNQPGYWGEDCSKIDEYQGGNSWESDQTYRLVVLKAGTELTIYENVQQGQVLTSGNGKDISHIITCPSIPTSSTSTTVPSVTSTTETVISIPPTTNPPQRLTTTTTQTSESTTTTDSPGSTDTTVQPTTTTTDSAPPSTPTELPYTGSADYLWVLALVLLVGGAGLIAFGRGKS